ncbi:MAG: ABC transporter substrate-binding protein [Candidatus Nomurabacteria bacterium]|jgi:peptide/nickel transport system substrate-binding protein|nr:ABC transporter substrate-binding protein [Candidatus Nomurabacteria bacterium]
MSKEKSKTGQGDSTTLTEKVVQKLPNRTALKDRYRRVERATLQHVYRFLILRWRNLSQIRFHILGWMAIIVGLLLLTAGQSALEDDKIAGTAGVTGGLYSEGVVGDIGDINPIFAQTTEEQALSGLLYSGLFRYDESNHIAGDLVESYSLSEDGTVYSFTLKEDLLWSDGEKITTDDVIFTLNSIKNPQVKSTQYRNFAKLTVTKLDERKFSIKTSMSMMILLDLLTIGIMPQHQFTEVEAERLRDSMYSVMPAVSGPYAYFGGGLNNSGNMSYDLVANKKYHVRTPQIPSLQITSFNNSNDLREALLAGDINAAVGLNRADAMDAVERDSALELTQVTLRDGVMALFNTTSPLLANDGLRDALRLAVDRDRIRNSLAVDGVVPPALDAATYGDFTAKQPDWNVKQAKERLTELGWTVGRDGKLADAAGQKLELNIVVSTGTDYSGVAELLAEDWRALGAEVSVQYVDSRQLQSNYLVPRAYDVLLTQLKFGGADDLSAYWHSSNANPAGTNYSNYMSPIVDLAINNAQTMRDQEKLQAIYDSVVKHWVDDAPAIALYSPQLYYVSNRNITSLRPDSTIVDINWRFQNVLDWTATKKPVFNTL